MYRMLTALGRGFKQRIGWKRLGVAASLIIIAFAAATLVRTLKGIDPGVMLVALTEIPPHRIALAALCVVGAFCTLTFYDFFALRTIGKKHVPYRIAAMSSFTSYTIGHNIGATVFTGGAIRFRIYSDYGLGAVDVAKICFLSGLTFWLGNAFVLGAGMAWQPTAASAMDQLPPAINHRARDTEEVAVRGDGVGGRRPDAPEGVGGEAAAASGVVVVDRGEQSDRAFLNEVVRRQAKVAVAEGDRADEPHVLVDERCTRDAVTSSCACHEALGVSRGGPSRRWRRRR